MRNSSVERKTKETEITVSLSLDGGNADIDTGIGFFDHMLTALALHGGFGLCVKVKGDLYVDCHHTIEDTGIVLGKAFYEALGDKGGINRYGSFYIPMDEALAFASVDVSGRPFLVFKAIAVNAGITLHINSLYGNNSHHIIEAVFKAVAHALKTAVAQTNNGETLSTKGSLDL